LLETTKGDEPLKSFRRLFLVLVLLGGLSVPFTLSNNAAGRSESPGVKEYEEFHDVLHPLEHEALPKKDFARIRAEAGELVKRGEAIVKLGVPAGMAEKNVAEFRQELAKFGEFLKTFSKQAKSGSDEEVKESFSAVHDSFEMLWGMVPR
jgi:hypothetical protein